MTSDGRPVTSDGRPASPSQRPVLGAAMVVGAAALWGSLGLFGRLAFDHGASPLDVASVRAALAFVGVLPFALLRHRQLRLRAAHVPLIVGYGAIGVGFFYYIYLVAVDRLPLAVAAALLYTAPAFVVILAWSLRWEPVRPRRLVPLAMVLAGAFLVTDAIRVLLAPSTAQTLAIGGMAAGVASGVAYAIFTVLGKRIRQHYDVLTTIFYAYGIGAVVLAIPAPPWTVLVEHPDALPALLVMGLGPTLLAALLFYGGIRHIDASSASMLATIEPVVAALIGAAWLNEAVTGYGVVGIALIIAAALWLARREAAPPAG